MGHVTNDYKDRPNHHENNYKLSMQTGHPVLGLTESQWEQRQQHDQNFLME